MSKGLWRVNGLRSEGDMIRGNSVTTSATGGRTQFSDTGGITDRDPLRGTGGTTRETRGLKLSLHLSYLSGTGVSAISGTQDAPENTVQGLRLKISRKTGWMEAFASTMRFNVWRRWQRVAAALMWQHGDGTVNNNGI